ncbi:MAG: hypothetical protein ABEI75_03625 [Halobaculum sp.]
MRRRSALRAVGASAVGLAGLSVTTGTAVAAKRPDFTGLTRGVNFQPQIGSGDNGEANRVTTVPGSATVRALAAITYPDTADTTVSFEGFDSTPSEVDVALFDVSRGSVTGSSTQTVSFSADFEYDSSSDVDDFFVDLLGDTLIQ